MDMDQLHETKQQNNQTPIKDFIFRREGLRGLLLTSYNSMPKPKPKSARFHSLPSCLIRSIIRPMAQDLPLPCLLPVPSYDHHPSYHTMYLFPFLAR